MNVLEEMLDKWKPDWWIAYADPYDVAICVRGCTDGQSGTVQHRLRLRERTLQHILPIMQAAQEVVLAEQRKRST